MQDDEATAEQVKLTVLRMMKPQVAVHTEVQFCPEQAAAHRNCPVTPHTIVLSWSLMESKSSLRSSSMSARYMEKRTTRQKRIVRNIFI